MRTIQTAQEIFRSRPAEALDDAIGLAAVVALLLAGFLTPVFV